MGTSPKPPTKTETSPSGGPGPRVDYDTGLEIPDTLWGIKVPDDFESGDSTKWGPFTKEQVADFTFGKAPEQQGKVKQPDPGDLNLPGGTGQPTLPQDPGKTLTGDDGPQYPDAGEPGWEEGVEQRFVDLMEIILDQAQTIERLKEHVGLDPVE